MAIIEWQDKFSVQITQIDEQHKCLVKMINQLHDAMAAGSGKEALDTILVQMKAYCKTHFDTEEQLFAIHGYPEAQAHHQEHQKFIDKVDQIIEKSKKSKIGLSMEVMTFLKEWLTHHILQVDQAYAPFLRARM